MGEAGGEVDLGDGEPGVPPVRVVSVCSQHEGEIGLFTHIITTEPLHQGCFAIQEMESYISIASYNAC